MLAELAARGIAPDAAGARLYGPIGLDLGGDGPEAIALSIVAEVAAVTSGRAGGSLRDRRAPLHAPAHLPA
jgi:xanthine/CO dehydrogenase XdhC/CoxF family maturation factor